MSLGTRIKQAFDNKGVSLYRAEKEIGIGRSLLSKYISNENDPSVSNIKQISEYLGVSLDWLILGQEKTSLNIGHSTNGKGNKVKGDIKFTSCEANLREANIRIDYLEAIIKDKEKIIKLLSKNQ